MFSARDHYWQTQALKLAATAAQQGEVPVGAVLVAADALLGEGYNSPIRHCDPTAHAEIIALRAGALARRNYRLIATTLYVTLEPCLMCLGALVQARVDRVVYGATDLRAGALSSLELAPLRNKLNHQPQCEGGLLADACAELLQEFFRAKRRQ